MAQNKPFRLGPVALILTTPTNICNPGTTTGGVASGSGSSLYIILKHIKIVNVTGSNASFTMAIGTTAVTPTSANAFMGFGTIISANSSIDWYGSVRLDVADFLVGFSNTTAALTLTGEGEIGIL